MSIWMVLFVPAVGLALWVCMRRTSLAILAPLPRKIQFYEDGTGYRAVVGGSTYYTNQLGRVWRTANGHRPCVFTEIKLTDHLEAWQFRRASAADSDGGGQ